MQVYDDILAIKYKGGDFRNYLQDCERVSSLFSHTEGECGIRSYYCLSLHNAFFFSIQASFYHYSTPRKTLDDAFQYTCFEVAIFDEKGEWVNFNEMNITGFMYMQEWSALCDGHVAGYMPVEMIQALIEHIYIGQA